jgi:hypothetical protein
LETAKSAAEEQEVERYNIAALLMITGIILPIAAWKNFRKAGVPFWRFAPLLRMHHFLHPVGTGLCWVGVATALSGVALRWIPI